MLWFYWRSQIYLVDFIFLNELYVCLNICVWMYLLIDWFPDSDCSMWLITSCFWHDDTFQTSFCTLDPNWTSAEPFKFRVNLTSIRRLINTEIILLFSVWWSFICSECLEQNTYIYCFISIVLHWKLVNWHKESAQKPDCSTLFRCFRGFINKHCGSHLVLHFVMSGVMCNKRLNMTVDCWVLLKY